MNATTTQDQSVRIVGVDTDPGHDPYHSGQNRPTICILIIDPREWVAAVGSNYDQSGSDADVWHARVIEVGLDLAGDEERYIEADSYVPNSDALAEYLNSDEAQHLLAAICDEYEIVWDGNNNVGRHTTESQAALDALLSAIESLPHTAYSLWAAADWLGSAADNDITAMTTDEELVVMAENVGYDYNGGEAVVVLDEDPLDYLTGLRDELRAEAAEDDEDDEDE